MPEGIVPELVIVAALLAAIAIAVLVSRRTRPPGRAATDREESTDATTTSESTRGPGVVTVDVAETADAEVRAEPEGRPRPEPEAPPRVPEELRPTLRDRLSRSRNFIADRIATAFREGSDDELWDDLEAGLIQADLGPAVAQEVVAGLRNEAKEKRATEPEAVRALLKARLLELFDLERERGLQLAPEGVTVWLVVGVNGAGKTTTIGKLARDLSERGRTVAVAAADTFRAAADEQLGAWAERTGAQLVKHQPGADPGAVAFDALRHSRARGIDVLIVDTAGRLHTKTPLMDELAKVRRVIEKEGSVAETLLVIDATSGQNGLVQAREFAEAVGVTGIALTKLDGTAKGGIAVAIERSLDLPIKLVGIGEDADDLEPFDPKTFVDALLD